jgi:hypothetical protein
MNEKKDEQHKVYYDPERKAIVEENAHNAPANRAAKIKEIAGRYPPYNVGELRKAIRTKREQIDELERSARKLKKEITDFQALAKKCEQRDRELAPYLDG